MDVAAIEGKKYHQDQFYLDLDEHYFKGYVFMFSIENEAKTWDFIIKTCDQLLAKYPTSYEDDQNILMKNEEAIEAEKDDVLSVNKTNCILYRMSEKEVVVFLLASVWLE